MSAVILAALLILAAEIAVIIVVGLRVTRRSVDCEQQDVQRSNVRVLWPEDDSWATAELIRRDGRSERAAR